MLTADELGKKKKKQNKNTPDLYKKTLSKSLVMSHKLLLKIRLYWAACNSSCRKEKAF